MNKNPPPPEVDDVFEGPRIGHGSPTLPAKNGRYYVRAVVDNEGEDPQYGWIYQVVFRFYTRHKGWRYEIVSSTSIGAGLYTRINKRRSKKG